MGESNFKGEERNTEDLERQESARLFKPGSEEQEEEETPQDNPTKTILIVLASLILFFGLFALITWLALRPVYSPTYSIHDVLVRTLAVNATASSVDANIAFNVTALNPNRRMGFKYSFITIDTFYAGHNIGRATILSFHQGTRSNVTREAAIDVRKFAGLPQNTFATLNTAIRNGSVPLRAFAAAKLYVKMGQYVSFPLSVNVDCRLVVSPPSPSRPAQVMSKACKLTRSRYKKARRYHPYQPLGRKTRV